MEMLSESEGEGKMICWYSVICAQVHYYKS